MEQHVKSHGIPLQVSILPRTSVPGNILRKKSSNDSSPIILTNRSSAMLNADMDNFEKQLADLSGVF